MKPRVIDLGVLTADADWFVESSGVSTLAK